jgi:hypothetical protein
MSSGESMSKGRPGGQARVKSARSLYKEQKGGQPERLSEIDFVERRINFTSKQCDVCKLLIVRSKMFSSDRLLN